MAGDVFAGARMPCQAPTSKPGMPLSFNVGTSGNTGDLSIVDTAMGRIRFSFTNGSPTVRGSMLNCISPPTRPITDGALPL